MFSCLMRPACCKEVQSQEDETLFLSLLDNHMYFCGLKEQSEELPNAIARFIAASDKNNVFAAIALHHFDPWNKTIVISCVTDFNQDVSDIVPAVVWITGLGFYEKGAEKVYTLLGQGSKTPVENFYIEAGFTYDAFLRDHIVMKNGERSSALVYSVLRHEYERQHLWKSVIHD